jgi:hypothetical protein
MAGTMAVGVLERSAPKISVRGDAFSVAKLVTPLEARTYITEFTAPGLPIQLNVVGSKVTPGLLTMPSMNHERPGTASVSPSGTTRRVMCVAATRPAAASMFCTTRPGWPGMNRTRWRATVRAVVSTPPPGANPTITVMVLPA